MYYCTVDQLNLPALNNYNGIGELVDDSDSMFD